MITVVCWNIGRTHQPLEELLAMDADLALLQEVHPGGIHWLNRAGANVAASPYDPWLMRHPETGAPTYDRWPQVVKLSPRVNVEWFRPVAPTLAINADELAVSHIGAIAAAKVTPQDETAGAPFLAVSMYARWLRPHPGAAPGPIYSDASAHSIISDLTASSPTMTPQTPPTASWPPATSISITTPDVAATPSPAAPTPSSTVWTLSGWSTSGRNTPTAAAPNPRPRTCPPTPPT